MYRYPAPLKVGDKIAVTAPSSGVPEALHPRLDLVLKALTDKGFQIVEGQHLRQNPEYVSASAQTRADEFMQFLLDDSIAAVIPPYGGEFGIEILPLLDFSALKQCLPKWIVGYSDISNFLCAISANAGWATLHASCLMEWMPEQRDTLTSQVHQVLALTSGDSVTQRASEHYQAHHPDWANRPSVPFQLDTPTKWQHTGANIDSSFKGRLFGGCLDTLVLMLNNRFIDFDKVKQHHGNDATILYLENAEMSPMALKRAFNALAFRGVFDNVSGLLLGRNSGANDPNGQLSFEQVTREFFVNADYPVLFDTDIGHKAPNLNLINGAMAEVGMSDGKGWIKQSLI